jgi:trehalose/maltose transport system permease protein
MIPLAQTVYLSFTNDRLADLRPAEWVGLDNYRRLLDDEDFRSAIWVTVRFTLITLVFEFLLGLMIALVVNSNFKGRGMMRAAMLVPWAIPTVISARMWAWMYNDIYGVFNDILVNRLGILDKNVAWIAQPNTSLWAVAAVDIWKTTPFVALLLLAGLQIIPSDIYEAATVDGANKIQQFFKITLPLLTPAILVALIFRTLDSLRVFDVFYVMFGARRDTQTMAIYAQNEIVAASRIGYGSAVSVAIFFIIAIFVVAYVTTLRVDRT